MSATARQLIGTTQESANAEIGAPTIQMRGSIVAADKNTTVTENIGIVLSQDRTLCGPIISTGSDRET